MAVEINWDNFSLYNNGPDGLRTKFENLCRQLFANEFLKSNKLMTHLHSDPNQPGIESEPIFDEDTNRYIGYQAKFFDKNVDYSQIYHSMENVVEYYAGKINHVVLYCNKAITASGKSYAKIVELLNKSEISIELITNEEILDIVRKYPYLANYYFGVNVITFDWIIAHDEKSFNTLGERFNREFNVETETSKKLSLFARNQNAIQYINRKKEKLLQKIAYMEDHTENHADYLKEIKTMVLSFEDIDSGTLEYALEWHQRLQSSIAEDVKKINLEISQKTDRLSRTRSLLERRKIDKEEWGRSQAEEEYNKLQVEIDTLYELLDLSNYLSLTADEGRLITAKELFISGNAGIGKSHMLAAEVQSLMKNNQPAILLLAGNCYSDLPILDQLLQDCELNYSFDEFISILESMGREQDAYVLLCIDALNETVNYGLWKTGLCSLLQKVEKCTRIKLAITYRTEYENSLVPDNLISKDKNVYKILHSGFESIGLEASMVFFNYYKIPFTLYEYFEAEMENPLFLTLYCKTYRNDEASLPVLYDRLVENVNKNIFPILIKRYNLMGLTEGDNLVQSLVDEISTLIFDKKEKSIMESDLANMRFWKLNGFPVRPFMALLEKENLMHTNLVSGQERYFFSYDQMNDYFFAKSLFSQNISDTLIRKILCEEILQLKDNHVNLSNCDIFVTCCSFYAQEFGNECIDVIDDLPESFEKDFVVRTYIRSFVWREKKYISNKVFLAAAKKYNVSRTDFWNVLIGNSVKSCHPLNADFLHTLLMGYALSERDYYWTKYINGIFYDDSNRLVQLLRMYSSGKSLQMNKEQARKLLILCGWLLSSSNRILRDYTSQAMIEILRNKFDLWIRLSNYICSGREQLKAERLLTWSWLYAYFVTEEQFEQFQVAATDRVDFSSSKGIGLDPQSYSVFNREYPWSPSCDLLNKSSSVESGVVLNMPEEKEVEQEVLNVEFLEQYLKSLDADSNQVFSDQELNQHLFKKEIVRKPVLKQIGEIIHASMNLVWESEYDASKDCTLSMNVPCPMLIEQLNLHQEDIDGLYYDSSKRIAAFDLKISQEESGVVIRKSLLDDFLQKNNLKLIWFVRASKELHDGKDLAILRYSDRSGAYFYNNTDISSTIYIVEQR